VPELDARRKEFEALDAQVLDISVDSIHSHIAWRKKELGEVTIPLCADFYPHGDVTQAFGILRQGAPVPGISERAAFIVDKNGKIVFAEVYPLNQLPDVDELLQTLNRLQESGKTGTAVES
jgi:alkyl hydroperoxide reductase subunit AhpC